MFPRKPGTKDSKDLDLEKRYGPELAKQIIESS